MLKLHCISRHSFNTGPYGKKSLKLFSSDTAGSIEAKFIWEWSLLGLRSDLYPINPSTNQDGPWRCHRI